MARAALTKIPRDEDPSGSSEPLVGRTAEMARLESKIAELGTPGIGLAMIEGAPGIGKTRLLREVERLARARGAVVLWGRCWREGSVPPFWLWSQVLRAAAARGALTNAHAASVLQGIADAGNLTVVQDADGVVPNLRLVDAPLPRGHRLARTVDAIAQAVLSSAIKQPCCFLLDDLNCADAASLQALLWLLGQSGQARILIVGAYSPAQLLQTGRRRRLLAEVVALGARISLSGLTVEALRAIAERLAQGALRQEQVQSLVVGSEGNPLILRELIALARSQGSIDLAVVPPVVRQALLRRMDGLADWQRAIVAFAAVVGVEVDTDLVKAAATPFTSNQIEVAMQAAVDNGILAVGSSAALHFVSKLLRGLLYAELSPAVREAAHLAIANALARRHRSGQAGMAVQAATHCLHAGDIARRTHGASLAVDAARELAKEQDHAGEVAWLRRAVELSETAGGVSELSARLVLLGGALERAEHFGEAAKIYSRAAYLARSVAAPVLLAEAAVGLARVYPQQGFVNAHLVGLIEEALSKLPTSCAPLRAALLGALAVSLYFSASPDERDRASAQAVEVAEQSGDARVLSRALLDRHFALWHPGTEAERRRIADRIVAIAEAQGDCVTAGEGRRWRIIDLLELGEAAPARGEIETYRELAQSQLLPHHQWHAALFHTALAILGGHLDAAALLAQEAFGRGISVEPENADQFFVAQKYLLARERGLLSEVEADVRRLVLAHPAAAIWRAALALLCAETNRCEEARELMEQLVANDLSSLPWNSSWLPIAACMAEVAVIVEDQVKAKLLLEALQPYASSHVVVATGAGLLGPVPYFLGRLCEFLEFWEEAETYYNAALTASRHSAATALALRAEFGSLRARIRSAQAVDGKAAKLIGSMGELQQRARALGLLAVESQVSRYLHPQPRVPLGTVTVPSHSNDLDHDFSFLREGEYWLIRYGARSLRVAHAKGVAYLAHLVATPGDPVHAVHLQAVGDGVPIHELNMIHLRSDRQPIADKRALAEYRTRLGELRAEIDEATRFNDLGRKDRLEGEIHALQAELRAILGCGGRSRNTISPAERARQNVNRAIVSALRRIQSCDSTLGYVLRKRVRTGNYCVYEAIPVSTRRSRDQLESACTRETANNGTDRSV